MSHVIFVTAISSEVGLQYLEQYHGCYERIIGQYRSITPELQMWKERLGDKLILLRADLEKAEAVDEMIKEMEKRNLFPDTFLHLPALKYELIKFHKISRKRLTAQLRVQVESAFYILQALLPKMAKKKYGRIAFVLSSAVGETAPKYLSDYVVAKYGLLGLMKALSAEYADKGITFNSVSPGMMETKLLSNTPEVVLEKNAAENPLGRNIRISDILPVIYYFLSEETEQITGQNIRITGGR